MSSASKRLVIFASGGGSNAEAVTRYLHARTHHKVIAVACNQAQAPVIARMRRLHVPVLIFSARQWEDDFIRTTLRALHTDALALLGFLWKVPTSILAHFPQRVVNLHPSLLPDFGGPGMYGKHVHEAVISAGRRRSGITLHLADSEYDRGPILEQHSVEVAPGETPERLAAKIHALEQKEVPPAIHRFLERLKPY